jgi:shikimate kinase
VHLALIGFRCSGKTTVGRLLAKKAGTNFTDTDEMVEAMAGMKIHRFVALKGWRLFREIETEALAEALSGQCQVIATGGGIVLDPGNVTRLKRQAVVFWLRTPASVIRERIAQDGRRVIRPALTPDDPVREVDAVLEQRTPLYSHASDYTVDCVDWSAARIVEEIHGLLQGVKIEAGGHEKLKEPGA